MPDHVHLLLTALRDENGWRFPLVEIMQSLKSSTAHRINKLLHRSGPIWEEESFDHVLRSYESLKLKCEYIRQNPVRTGLVQKPEDYHWLWVNPKFEL
jgi:REP-associated tyrosine transposase